MMRLNEMPEIETYIVPSAEAPGGIGEPSTALAAGALLNAVAAATGKRLYRLPIRAGTTLNVQSVSGLKAALNRTKVLHFETRELSLALEDMRSLDEILASLGLLGALMLTSPGRLAGQAPAGQRPGGYGLRTGWKRPVRLRTERAGGSRSSCPAPNG